MKISFTFFYHSIRVKILQTLLNLFQNTPIRTPNSFLDDDGATDDAMNDESKQLMIADAGGDANAA